MNLEYLKVLNLKKINYEQNIFFIYIPLIIFIQSFIKFFICIIIHNYKTERIICNFNIWNVEL